MEDKYKKIEELIFSLSQYSVSERIEVVGYLNNKNEHLSEELMKLIKNIQEVLKNILKDSEDPEQAKLIMDKFSSEDGLNQEILATIFERVELNLKHYTSLKIFRKDQEKASHIFEYIFNNHVMRNNIDYNIACNELNIDKHELYDLCDGVWKLVTIVLNKRLGNNVAKKMMKDQYFLDENLIDFILSKINENYGELQLNLISQKLDILLAEKK
jgi:hypothetical protein